MTFQSFVSLSRRGCSRWTNAQDIEEAPGVVTANPRLDVLSRRGIENGRLVAERGLKIEPNDHLDKLDFEPVVE